MQRWSLVLLQSLGIVAVTSILFLGVRKLGGQVQEAHGAFSGDGRGRFYSPFEPPRVEIATSKAGTFLGMKDEIILDHIRSASIVEAKLNKGGSSISFRLTFTDGTRAAFKPQQINPQTIPRKEVAAYRLDRLLGMNGVPPAAMRTVHRDNLVGKLPAENSFSAGRIDAETIFDSEGFTQGEVSAWIPTIVDSHLDTLDSVMAWWKWMTIGEQIPSDKVNLMAQLSSLLVLDMLENNSDRFSGGNMMTSPDGRTLYFMDNTFGFQIEPEGHLKCRTYLLRCQKFSRRLISTLRTLDTRSLYKALKGEEWVLSREEIDSVIARKEATLKYVDSLIAHYGQERVLVFP